MTISLWLRKLSLEQCWIPAAPPCTWELCVPQIQRDLPPAPLSFSQPPPNTHTGAAGCTLGLEMWFVLSRDRLNHLCDIPVCEVRKKIRGSMLEPKSDPHGIQADLPKYSPNIQVVPSGSIEL